jgi:acetyl-CoA carboxylase carboxyl transferase subunit beta
LVGAVLDPESFRSWDQPIDLPTDPGYRATLIAAGQRSGADEAVCTGHGLVAGRPLAVVCSEFGFLGGTIGQSAADRIVAAVRRATEERLPLLALPASGGTRIQEGTPAFLRMTGIAAAVAEHKAAGFAYLVYVRHPTTGGVLASWGSLGHLTLAEPQAMIGFLGPKVYSALNSGERFPAGVQTAENLHAHGLIDAVVAPEDLRDVVSRFLGHIDPRFRRPRPDPLPSPRTLRSTPASVRPICGAPWESVTSTRRPDRPGLRELLRHAAAEMISISRPHRPIMIALTRFGRTSCVLVGQDRAAQQTTPIGPADMAAARRGIRLAGDLGLPLVTVIDTPGAELSRSAEQGGLAQEIARSLADLVAAPTPTMSVLLGQGAGGAAVALLPADWVIAAEQSWLTPLPPEGASVILHGTVDRAKSVTAGLQCTSAELRALGVIDRVVAEEPDAADNPRVFLDRLARIIAADLRRLVQVTPGHPGRGRVHRWARPAQAS